jgi:hypothetical protein
LTSFKKEKYDNLTNDKEKTDFLSVEKHLSDLTISLSTCQQHVEIPKVLLEILPRIKEYSKY